MVIANETQLVTEWLTAQHDKNFVKNTFIAKYVAPTKQTGLQLGFGNFVRLMFLFMDLLVTQTIGYEMSTHNILILVTTVYAHTVYWLMT